MIYVPAIGGDRGSQGGRGSYVGSIVVALATKNLSSKTQKSLAGLGDGVTREVSRYPISQVPVSTFVANALRGVEESTTDLRNIAKKEKQKPEELEIKIKNCNTKTQTLSFTLENKQIFELFLLHLRCMNRKLFSSFHPHCELLCSRHEGLRAGLQEEETAWSHGTSRGTSC